MPNCELVVRGCSQAKMAEARKIVRSRLWTCTGYEVQDGRAFLSGLLGEGGEAPRAVADNAEPPSPAGEGAEPPSSVIPVGNRPRWVCGQLERCPDTGREHLQYTIYYDTLQTLTALKKNVHPQHHFEASRGTVDQNLAYCTKDDSRIAGPWQFGVKPAQGRRTDLETLGRDIVSGTYRTLPQLAMAHPGQFIRYSAGMTRLFDLMPLPPRRYATKCFWVWGPSQVGKTQGWRHAGIPFQDVFEVSYEEHNKSWFWYRYNQQSVVIFDECCKAIMPPKMMMGFHNVGQPFSVPVKGQATVGFDSRFVICTANRPPNGDLMVLEEFRNRWQVIHVRDRADTSAFWRRIVDLTADTEVVS